MKRRARIHEVYVLCTDRTYERLVRLLARAFGFGVARVEERFESLMAQVVRGLTRSDVAVVKGLLRRRTAATSPGTAPRAAARPGRVRRSSGRAEVRGGR
jgi:hypothetical protein